MRTTIVRSAFLLASAMTLASCNGTGLPSTPSVLTTQAAPAAGSASFRLLDDPITPGPANPILDPTAPATPVSIIIDIIGTFGFNAFSPNPIQAALGDLIVWTNNDSRVHHIMFDDGTDVGEVAPGQSSVPVPLMGPSATFHCTIHPSMVGTIGDLSAIPVPDPPAYFPTPPDDSYGYY